MPQTNTAINFCDAVIEVDNDGGVLTDISGSSNSVTLSPDVLVGEAGTFGDKWAVRLTCGLDLPITIVVLYTTAANEGWDILKEWFFTYFGAARSVRIRTPDATAGSDSIAGEFILDDMSWTGEARQGDPVLITANLLPSGEITLAAIGS